MGVHLAGALRWGRRKWLGKVQTRGSWVRHTYRPTRYYINGSVIFAKGCIEGKLGAWSCELGKTGRNEWTTLRISKKAETHTYRWPSIRPILIRCCNYKSSQILLLPDLSSLYVFNAIQFVEVIFTWRVESPYWLRWGFGAVLPGLLFWSSVKRGGQILK